MYRFNDDDTGLVRCRYCGACIQRNRSLAIAFDIVCSYCFEDVVGCGYEVHEEKSDEEE